MKTHNEFREMNPLSLSQFLSRYSHLLGRLYASAGLRAPHPLDFAALAGVDCGDNLFALLGSTRFQCPTRDAADSNSFVAPACLDLVDITRETVRGRVVLSDMHLGLAAARYRPDIITDQLAAYSRDRGLVFSAVQHTRELRSSLTPPAPELSLRVRYIECITVTDKGRCDEDGTLLVRLALSIGDTDFTHAMVIPDGASERAMVASLGFQKASGKTSCWFYTATIHTEHPETAGLSRPPSTAEPARTVPPRDHARAFT